MFRCKIINFFFFIFPLKTWRDFLIRFHGDKCPYCQKKLASVEEVKPFLIREEEFENYVALWPAVKKKLGEEERERMIPFWRRWNWAYGAAGLFVALAASIWLYFAFTPEKELSEESLKEQFQINYIEIENKPARAFLYCPRNSKMIIVWAEKNL